MVPKTILYPISESFKPPKRERKKKHVKNCGSPGAQHVVRHVFIVRSRFTLQKSVSQKPVGNRFTLWKVQRVLLPHLPLKMSFLSVSPSKI